MNCTRLSGRNRNEKRDIRRMHWQRKDVIIGPKESMKERHIKGWIEKYKEIKVGWIDEYKNDGMNKGEGNNEKSMFA